MVDWFVQGNLTHVEPDAGIKHVMPLYVVNERMKILEYFPRPGVSATWRRGKTFSEWAGRYVSAALGILEKAGLDD